jgi:choline/ethanolamine kinase
MSKEGESMEQQREQIINKQDDAKDNIARSKHWLHWQEEIQEDGESREMRMKKSQARANSFPFKTALLYLVHATLGKWGNLLPKDIKVQRMTTALSNVVLKVSISNNSNEDLEALVIKIHGYTDVALKELRWLRVLSSNPFNHAPALLAEFGNGHIEKSIDAFSLTSAQMRDLTVAQEVMRAMSYLHLMYGEIGGGENDLYKRVERWRVKAVNSGVPGYEKLTEPEYADKLMVKCQSVDSPLVLSHNDLQMGNILIDEKGRISLIDYEYSNIAPRAYDLANYFCEWMADYSDITNPETMRQELFPPDHTKRRLCAAYIKCEPDNPLIDSLLQEIQPFIPLSHLLWTYWALHQAKFSSIEFDYLRYAQSRSSFLE